MRANRHEWCRICQRSPVSLLYRDRCVPCAMRNRLHTRRLLAARPHYTARQLVRKYA